MPVAERITEPQRFDLKSAPPDGFVVLRQLSYDEILERRDGATKMLMERGPSGRNADSKMAVQIANKWSNSYSFPRCILDHNLTDKSGVKFGFSEKQIDDTFARLDPRVGAELEKLIDELNNEEEDENFTSAQNGSSPEESDKPQPSLAES